jgi:anti-sigma-K factor RskA
MTELTHDELRELIAPYVLGAVEDEERSIVRAHILTCDECMRAADEYSEVTSWLESEVEPVEVPAGFAQRVIGSATAGPETTVSADIVPLRRPPRWQWFAVAAMIAAIAVLSLSLFDTRSDLRFQERVVSALVREDGMTLDGATGAVGRMVPTSDGGIFVASGLQEAPDDHTYQLWVIREDGPTSAGVFDVDHGVVALDVESSLEGAEAVAVTVEPGGGSPEPTSEPILSS